MNMMRWMTTPMTRSSLDTTVLVSRSWKARCLRSCGRSCLSSCWARLDARTAAGQQLGLVLLQELPGRERAVGARLLPHV